MRRDADHLRGLDLAEVVSVRRRRQLRAADGLHARREGQAGRIVEERAGEDVRTGTKSERIGKRAAIFKQTAQPKFASGNHSQKKRIFPLSP